MHLSGGTADTPNRVALRAGRRSRWLAPVYGLVISFLSVLLLGVVVSEPAAPTTSTTQPVVDDLSVDVRLVTAATAPGSASAPATELKGAAVKVLAGSAQDLVVGANGEVDDVTSGESLTICVDLPDKWSGEGTAERVSGSTCWSDVARSADGRIELLVRENP